MGTVLNIVATATVLLLLTGYLAPQQVGSAVTSVATFIADVGKLLGGGWGWVWTHVPHP